MTNTTTDLSQNPTIVQTMTATPTNPTPSGGAIFGVAAAFFAAIAMSYFVGQCAIPFPNKTNNPTQNTPAVNTNTGIPRQTSSEEFLAQISPDPSQTYFLEIKDNNGNTYVLGKQMQYFQQFDDRYEPVKETPTLTDIVIRIPPRKAKTTQPVVIKVEHATYSNDPYHFIEALNTIIRRTPEAERGPKLAQYLQKITPIDPRDLDDIYKANREGKTLQDLLKTK